MTDPNEDDVRDLADLNVAAIRAGNDHVDDRMSEMESQISDLEQQIATLEDEKEDLEADKEAAESLLADFRDTQRDEQLRRIRQANEAVGADEEIDLDTLEDASVDQLETVAEMLESATATTQVSNRDSTPDISGIDSSAVDDDVEGRKAQLAEKEGLARLYEKAQTDGFEVDHTQPGPGTTPEGASMSDLIDAVEASQSGGEN